jgi:hypothetical protein
MNFKAIKLSLTAERRIWAIITSLMVNSSRIDYIGHSWYATALFLAFFLSGWIFIEVVFFLVLQKWYAPWAKRKIEAIVAKKETD